MTDDPRQLIDRTLAHYRQPAGWLDDVPSPELCWVGEAQRDIYQLAAALQECITREALCCASITLGLVAEICQNGLLPRQTVVQAILEATKQIGRPDQGEQS